MRKHLLHVLIISFVFLSIPDLHVFAIQTRAMEPVLIKDKQGKQVGLYKESHALVIGIDNYTKGWSRLSNAVKDADTIAEELEKQGFEVTLRKNLTGKALREELRQFFIIKGSTADARLLFWFSGHGHTIDGEGFLVPADAPVPTSNQFMVTSLHMRDFGGLVRLAKSKHVLSIFDSCFAGTIFNTRSGMLSPAITRATALPVRQFLTSGDADQQVSDDGSFRELFLRAIRGEEWADANKDGYLTGSELGSYLSDRVTNLTHAAQVPRYGKLLDVKYDRGDFVFALGRDIYEQQKPDISLPPAIERDDDTFEKIAKEREESKVKWSDWQTNMSGRYSKNYDMDEGNVLKPSEKVQMWDKFLVQYSTDNPYSTEDQLIRSKAMERLNYWKNWNPPEMEDKPLLSQGLQLDRQITNLRSSYRDLSVSQARLMPNISIRKKKKSGFYGHSTIIHRYDLKSIGGDKVILDHATGLMWHQSGSDKRMKWNKAKNWVRSLNSMGYAGYHNWRLPTAEEAASLLESSKSNGLYIDSFFSNKQEWIWTGDKYGSAGAWGVNYRYGHVNLRPLFSPYVRPVRSGNVEDKIIRRLLPHQADMRAHDRQTDRGILNGAFLQRDRAIRRRKDHNADRHPPR